MNKAAPGRSDEPLVTARGDLALVLCMEPIANCLGTRRRSVETVHAKHGNQALGLPHLASNGAVLQRPSLPYGLCITVCVDPLGKRDPTGAIQTIESISTHTRAHVKASAARRAAPAILLALEQRDELP